MKKKLAANIKNYSKSFYAYVRSKQKVRDKVGSLENNSENIISDGCQMAEVLNEYFSSVFTTEDISSLPITFTKFEGNKSEQLWQLFLTPEMIAKKIKKRKDNKSPRVDGIPPKLLKEIVEQISTPLAKVFNLSLEEGIVPCKTLINKYISTWVPKNKVMSNQSLMFFGRNYKVTSGCCLFRFSKSFR